MLRFDVSTTAAPWRSSRHQLAIAAHAVEQVVARQRVAAARLGEPAQQHLVARVEEHHLEAVAGAAQLRERRAATRRGCGAGARRSRSRACRGRLRARGDRPSATTSGTGMLSTHVNSMSSSARSAVLLPAPDSPVTMTICIYSTASALSVSCIARCSLSRNARAEWMPCALSSWLRAATSISVAMLRPGRTGKRSFGTATSSSARVVLVEAEPVVLVARRPTRAARRPARSPWPRAPPRYRTGP